MYYVKGYCTLFPSLEFFPIGFFSSKVLMRHIMMNIQGGML